MRKVIFISIALFSAVATAEVLTEKINTIALFKNGSGYFLSSVDVPADTENFQITPEVSPVFGTFWVSWDKGVELQSLVAQEKDFDKPIEAVTVEELLKANIGAQIRINVDEGYVSGKLVSFDEKKSPPQPVNREKSNLPPYRQKFITVESTAGTVVMNTSQIDRVHFIDGGISRDGTKTEKKVSLCGKFKEKNAETELFLSYLGKGITWAPSYSVDISEEGKAALTAKALIVNEAADIENAEILLITGYPQLAYSDILSPISLENTLNEFLKSLGKGGDERPESSRRMLNTAKSLAAFDSAGYGGQALDYGAAAEGKQLEDMFFYPVEDVTLKKDQTGYYPLFSVETECEHIYEWQIDDNIDRHYRYNQNQEDEQVVWHSIRLKNDTGKPWTSAPVQTVKENLLLGQSTLDYTLDGEKTTVKITQAASVKANQVEYVSKRVPNSAKFFGTSFDEVTIDGKLFVTNTKQKPIKMEIAKRITGKLVESEPQADVDRISSGVGQVNETQLLKWTVEVAGEEKIELNYSYKAYLRR